MSIATELIARGAEIIKPLTYEKSREEISNELFSVNLELKYKNSQYYFELLTTNLHAQTEEVALRIIWPKKIKVLSDSDDSSTSYNESKAGTYYDGEDHAFVSYNKILLNKEGWSLNPDLRDLVESKRRKLYPNNNDVFTQEDEQELLDNGFEVLLDIT